MTNNSNPLDALYTEGAVTDTAGLYDSWAAQYEADLRAIGYAAADRCPEPIALVGNAPGATAHARTAGNLTHLS